MKYYILLIFFLFVFFSNSVFSRGICSANGNSFYDCREDESGYIKETKEQVLKKIVLLLNKGMFASAKDYADKNGQTDAYHGIVLRPLVVNKQFDKALNYADKNNMTAEYHTIKIQSLVEKNESGKALAYARQHNILKQYKLVEQFMISQQRRQQKRRRLAAQQQPRRLAAQQQRREESKYKYEGMSGQRYQYDLSDPVDRIMYDVDPVSKIFDDINPDPMIDLDRRMGEYGGGAQW